MHYYEQILQQFTSVPCFCFKLQQHQKRAANAQKSLCVTGVVQYKKSSSQVETCFIACWLSGFDLGCHAGTANPAEALCSQLAAGDRACLGMPNMLSALQTSKRKDPNQWHPSLSVLWR